MKSIVQRQLSLAQFGTLPPEECEVIATLATNPAFQLLVQRLEAYADRIVLDLLADPENPQTPKRAGMVLGYQTAAQLPVACGEMLERNAERQRAGQEEGELFDNPRGYQRGRPRIPETGEEP